MKASKLTYLMAIGLSLTFVATGCKKKPVGVTNLPGRGAGRIGEGAPASGGTFNPGTGVEAGGGNTAEWNPENFNADRAAFAAQTVHFDYDSSTVKSSEQHHVQAVASGLGSDNAAKLLIEGHCDERGTEEYNRSLGERRALALREELAKMGVDPGRIRTISFGEDQPVAQGHDESAYSQNRRGVFVLMHPK